ncbi:hypothetical protein BH11MYX2_BH11MYX2_03360 [soil metagenome]
MLRLAFACIAFVGLFYGAGALVLAGAPFDGFLLRADVLLMSASALLASATFVAHRSVVRPRSSVLELPTARAVRM